MSLRIVATILVGLPLLEFVTGPGATAAEPPPVELLGGAVEYVREGRSFVELAFRELTPPTVVRGTDSQPDVPAAGRVLGQRGRPGSVEFVEGLAAFSGFRQAGVSTQEELRLPGPEAR